MSALWLPLAFLAAVFSATAETARKRLVRDLDPFGVAFLTAAVSAAALVPAVILEGLAAPGPDYAVALAVSGGINVVAAVLIARSYQLGDLSFVTPLKGLTPVFTLTVAVAVLGEVPSLLGLAGVGTVTLGTYLLATSRGSGDVTGPLRALWADRGARLMLAVAFLYGISSTYDKVGVLASAPVFWGFSLQATVAAVTGVRVLGSERGRSALTGMSGRSGSWRWRAGWPRPSCSSRR